jgi:hypothetical protein
MNLWSWRLPLVGAAFASGVLAAINSTSAQEWTPTAAPNSVWTGLAASADGIKLAASGISPWVIYTSTNSGSTWTLTSAPNEKWYSIASSADGTKLVAVANADTSSQPAGVIATSTNSGATWRTTNEPAVYWRSVASSADGSLLVAAGQPGLYISTNFGLTWTLTSAPPNAPWGSVACSADGARLVAAAILVYLSTNSGATWTVASGPVAAWVASSADGAKLVAGGCGGTFYTSSDGGATWTAHGIEGINCWQSAASSADGTTLVLAPFYGRIFTSTNSGSDWTLSFDLPQNWGPVACSADGSKLLAAIENNGGIYRWQAIPVLSLGIYDSVPVVSWPSSSSAADFRLEQNSDLRTANWMVVTNAPTWTNGQMQVIVSPTDRQSFYRMTSF